MIKGKLRSVIVFALAAITGAVLVVTSQAVQRTENDLKKARAELAQEQEQTHMLNVEQEFLTAPERLDTLIGQGRAPEETRIKGYEDWAKERASRLHEDTAP